MKRAKNIVIPATFAVALAVTGLAQAQNYTIEVITSGQSLSIAPRPLSENGHVTGTTYQSTYDPNSDIYRYVHRAFVWQGGSFMALGNLGTDGNDNESAYSNAVNDSGEVVGASAALRGGNFYHQPVRWDGAAPTSLKIPGATADGFQYGEARDINASGIAVGYAYGATSGFFGAVRWDDSSATVLAPPDATSGYSYAQAINETGQVAGYGYKNYVSPGAPYGDIAVRWNDTIPTPLFAPTTRSDGYSHAYGVHINASGQVVGHAEKWINGNYLGYHAVIWNGTTPTAFEHPLADRLQYQYTYPTAMNDAGAVVGFGYGYDKDTGRFTGYGALLWQNGTATEMSLGTCPSAGYVHSFAYDINNQGDVVGSSYTASCQYHAFLYRNGGVVDLHDLLPSGSGWSNIQYAAAINDAGQILVTGDYNGQYSIGLMTPANQKPSLVGLVNKTLEAASGAGAVATYSITATDPEDGTLPASCTPASGATFSIGATPISCSATDSNGSTVTGGFTVIVVDTTRPVVNVPTNIAAEATSAAGRIVTFITSATDTVSGSLTPTCTPPSGSPFGLGIMPVTCTATDAAGNTGSAAFSVKVQDTTAPALTCPANITGIPGKTVNLGPPTVSDAVDTTPTVGNNAPATFPPGQTTVTWTATDDAGNRATCSQTVTLRYTYQGFFQPVDNIPVVNTVKGGSTVPIKWRLVDANGANVTNTAVVTSTTFVPMTCGGSEDAIEQTVATGGTSLRWDASEMQFIYNWKTPATPGKCVRLTIGFNDGTTQSANFKLK